MPGLDGRISSGYVARSGYACEVKLLTRRPGVVFRCGTCELCTAAWVPFLPQRLPRFERSVLLCIALLLASSRPLTSPLNLVFARRMYPTIKVDLSIER